MSLIYNNVEIPCTIDVHNWYEHGLTFSAEGHNYERKAPPHMLVYHWTGGEGEYDDVYRTLIRRELGIHFYIDYSGVVYQYCDPALVVCAHAGWANRYSIGVEMQNRGKLPARIQFPRSSYVDKIRGCTERMLYFRDAQVQSALALAEVFVDLGIIERKTLHDPKSTSDTCRSLLRDTVDRDILQEFSGVCGHFHISERKIDPGTDLLEAFIEAGY